LRRLRDLGPRESLLVPGFRSGDFDPYDDFSPTRPGAGPSGGPVPSFPKEGPSAGPGGPAKSADTPIIHCGLRFVDFDVAPGKSYKYRLRVRMMNPNYAPEPDKRKDTLPENARDKVLKSDWAYVSAVVTVPPDQHVYVPEFGPRLNAAMKNQEPWRWKLPPY